MNKEFSGKTFIQGRVHNELSRSLVGRKDERYAINLDIAKVNHLNNLKSA